MDFDTLYHGSTVAVPHPQLLPSKYTKDFGPGFYCTSIQTQAQRWATRRTNGVVTTYTYNINTALKILTFKSLSEDWLDFIVNCRTGIPHDFDIVEGPMADDEIFFTVQTYLRGEISREAFWAMAKFRYTTHQISFHTKSALSTIKYLGHQEVNR